MGRRGSEYEVSHKGSKIGVLIKACGSAMCYGMCLVG
jgi:hypothetical protein